jgi:hypothetical protein
VTSLLDLGIPQDAMMLRASEVEALYEGIAQKGFGVSSKVGALCREAPNATGLKTLWIKKQSNTIKRKSMTINNHRGTSERDYLYFILNTS